MEGEGKGGEGRKVQRKRRGKKNKKNIYGINSAIIMKSVNCRSQKSGGVLGLSGGKEKLWELGAGAAGGGSAPPSWNINPKPSWGREKWEFCRHFTSVKGLECNQQLVTKRFCQEILLPSSGAS